MDCINIWEEVDKNKNSMQRKTHWHSPVKLLMSPLLPPPVYWLFDISAEVISAVAGDKVR